MSRSDEILLITNDNLINLIYIFATLRFLLKNLATVICLIESADCLYSHEFSVPFSVPFQIKTNQVPE